MGRFDIGADPGCKQDVSFGSVLVRRKGRRNTNEDEEGNMNTTIATPLEIRWNKPAPYASPMPLVRHIVEPRTDLRCPCCNALVYSRRHKLCGVCAQELPKNFLFSEVQALKVEGLLQRERQKHRAWMKREGAW